MLKTAILDIEVRGEQLERFLNLSVYHGIVLWDIVKEEEHIRCRIRASDFFILSEIVRKTRVKLKILKKAGWYFKIKVLLSNKIFLLFFCIGITVICIFSQLLWNIEIEGNFKVSRNMICGFLQNEGVYYQMPLKEIKGDELEKKLRKEFCDITWISVSVEGTTLKVRIKENDTGNPLKENPASSDIVAEKAGVIESILVREGTKLVSVGDYVEKGSILIKGICQVPMEDGTEIKELPVTAKGDIAIVYELPIDLKILLEYETRVYSGKELKKYQLYTKNKVVNLNDSRIPFLQYDYYEEEITPYYLKLFFPNFKIIQRSYRDYLLKREKYQKKEAEKILNDDFDKIIKSLVEKGVQIIEKNVKIKSNPTSVFLEGNVKVREVFKEKNYRNE